VRRVRLDALLSERGLFSSRARAAASVLAGEVLLLPGRRRAAKPGQLVPEDVEFELVRRSEFVSRGGIKLQNALDALALDVTGRSALDIGASTGGFTDCLLQRGAARVTCVDVSYGQLAWKLRTDQRVMAIERRNARSLRADELPYAPDLIVIDVSFISVRKILPAALACADSRFDCLALVKPQFEVGRGHVGSGGVVRDPVQRRRVLGEVGVEAGELGASVLGFASSGLPGPKGNRETFVWLGEAARGGLDESGIAAAIGEVEP
jgi:23S rRNA (cytidine1920-2'-O)/16S rRNA (cytidine1409-2'-O)-methyltransferase